jgi:hypothetical protein
VGETSKPDVLVTPQPPTENASAIARLRRKKAELLQTGLYDEAADPIIREIDEALMKMEGASRQ